MGAGVLGRRGGSSAGRSFSPALAALVLLASEGSRGFSRLVGLRRLPSSSSLRSEGDGIHGLIPKSQIAMFRSLLQEGQVYYVQYMEVALVIILPLYVYRPCYMKDIAGTVTDKTYLADVIGLINGVSAFIELDVKGRRTSKRNLRITDGRITCIDHSVKWITERFCRIATDEIEQTTVAHLTSVVSQSASSHGTKSL